MVIPLASYNKNDKYALVYYLAVTINELASHGYICDIVPIHKWGRQLTFLEVDHFSDGYHCD